METRVLTRLSSFTDAEIDKVEASGMNLNHLLRFMEALINEAKQHENIMRMYEIKRTFDPGEEEAGYIYF